MSQVNKIGPSTVPQPTTQPAVPPQLAAQIDLLISLCLHGWPALTLAVQNSWGGQDSSDKRDWLAGEVSSLIISSPPQLHDVGDLEEVLLQVMIDEFEVVVDDDSAENIARQIWSGVQKLQKGETEELKQLWEKWEEKRRNTGGKEISGIVRGEDKEGEETDWDDEDDEDEEEFNGFPDRPDVSMAEAQQLSAKKEKIEPEIDEDGFTKVVGKKKR
jgi:pre-rRNA-processing protein TSR2